MNNKPQYLLRPSPGLPRFLQALAFEIFKINIAMLVLE
jgi:hypothetical protein